MMIPTKHTRRIEREKTLDYDTVYVVYVDQRFFKLKTPPKDNEVEIWETVFEDGKLVYGTWEDVGEPYYGYTPYEYRRNQ